MSTSTSSSATDRLVRIFLSYGHDDYASLALRIKGDLKSLGHDVWFDVERLRTAEDWSCRIQDGLDFASAVPDAGRFVLLMTPHSVRPPDGYCLNELSRASDRSLPIIPVMVSTVEPPLSICRLQWLDMRHCFPAEQHEDQYKNQFDRLVTALTEKQVPFEGVQQRLINYLQPIMYADDFRRHLSRFIGREWVIDKVNKWVADSQRVLWITGDAGVGKSALAVWLCEKMPEIIKAYHFCHFGNAERTDARKALFSLAYQLGTQLPVYWDRLNASPLDRTIVETNVPAVFDRLFVSLLTDAVPLSDKPYVLLIDALDEATSNGKNELASIVGREFNRLPDWVRMIVTSRPYEKEINFAFQALDQWKLDADRKENIQDLRQYLSCELPPFTGNGPPSEEVVRQILEKSEGLFLYVDWVRQELLNGRLSLLEVDKFPQGLGGIYAQFFPRYFPDLHEYGTLCRPALEAICAVREPIERSSLASLLGRSEYEMRQLIARLGSLFPVVDGRVRPFHQTVRDWLVDPDRSGDYWIDASAQEERLADLAWREYTGGVNAMGQYCIKYAPSHLVTTKRKDELKKLLLDPQWVQAKLRVSGVVPLLADYRLALDTFWPESSAAMSLQDDTESSAMQMIQDALRLSSHVIAEDPVQLVSQIVGRLLPHQGMPAIQQFTAKIISAAPHPWLRPLKPALHPPGTPLVRTLRGHTDAVKAVALTPDGQWAISASSDRTLKVWDLVSGKEIRTLRGHTDAVNAVALIPNGQCAISASSDRTLKVWDLANGEERRTLTGHRDEVHAVVATPDGCCAISGSKDGTIRIWDLVTGDQRAALLDPPPFDGSAPPPPWVEGEAITPNGRLLIARFHPDPAIRVWNLATGQELPRLENQRRVCSLTAAPCGRRVVACSLLTFKLWDLATGELFENDIPDAAAGGGLGVTPNGRCAVFGAQQCSLIVWNFDTGKKLRTLTGHTADVNAVAVMPDSRHVVSASDDGTLRVWDLAAESRPASPTFALAAVAVEPGGRYVIAADDSILKILDLESGTELAALAGHRYRIDAVAVTPDGRLAVSASDDATLKVWDLAARRGLHTLSGHRTGVLSVAVMPDGQHAVSGSADQCLKVWDLNSGREVRTLKGRIGWVYALAVLTDGRDVIFGSGDRLRLWNLETGVERLALRGAGEVSALTVTPDGRYVLTAAHGTWDLKVWDLENATEPRTLSGHAAAITALAMMPGGVYAVSVSRDRTIKVWDTKTWSEIATFTGDAPFSACATGPQNIIVAADNVVESGTSGRLHVLRLEV